AGRRVPRQERQDSARQNHPGKSVPVHCSPPRRVSPSKSLPKNWPAPGLCKLVLERENTGAAISSGARVRTQPISPLSPPPSPLRLKPRLRREASSILVWCPLNKWTKERLRLRLQA